VGLSFPEKTSEDSWGAIQSELGPSAIVSPAVLKETEEIARVFGDDGRGIREASATKVRERRLSKSALVLDTLLKSASSMIDMGRGGFDAEEECAPPSANSTARLRVLE
jgi:hypothetical protein